MQRAKDEAQAKQREMIALERPPKRRGAKPVEFASIPLRGQEVVIGAVRYSVISRNGKTITLKAKE